MSRVDELIRSRVAEIDAAEDYPEVKELVSMYARIIASRVVDGEEPLAVEVEPYRYAVAKLDAILATPEIGGNRG